jgi:hypothetical protein
MQKATPAPLKRSVVIALVLLAALFASFSASAQSSVPLHRLYNPWSTKHYYTTATTGPAYNSYPVYEGSLGLLLPSNAGCFYPLHALSNPNNGDRVLTIVENEKGYLTQIRKYVYEGILGYACAGDTYDPQNSLNIVYRYYNHSKREHFYTNNFNELGSGNHGYVYEGVAFALVR